MPAVTPSNAVSPSGICPVTVSDFCFPRENFAPGCPRNDDFHLARPIASPVLPVGLARSAAEGQTNTTAHDGSSKFKQLLRSGPPSAECPKDSGVPSAARVLESL